MSSDARPLLLASNRPSGAADGDGPRQDFLLLAERLRANLSYPTEAVGTLARLEKATALDFRQAWAAARRRNVSVYVSLSEKAGIPLALLLGHRRVPHVLIAHRLTSGPKRRLQRLLPYLQRFSRIVVLCRSQEAYLRAVPGFPVERVRFVHDKVDHHYFAPLAQAGCAAALTPVPSPAAGEGCTSRAASASARSLPGRFAADLCKASFTGHPSPAAGEGKGVRAAAQPACPSSAPLILSVGRERRDYETLAGAARRLPEARFVAVASSPWSRGGTPTGEGAPPNLTFRRGLSWPELRALYAEASVVAVPLMAGTDYAAGVNAVLEAMAMGKPLVVTATPGIADYVADGETCRVAPASDPDGLAAAVASLMANPADGARMGANARRVVESGRNLDAYVGALAQIVREVAP